MRMTVLVLMSFCVALAKDASITDVSGVWVADISRCDFGEASRPIRLVMNMTRTENRLNVIEVSTSDVGTDPAERQYVFGRSVLPIRSAMGTGKIADRMALLEWQDQRDQWRFSKDGLELIVTRWIGNSPAQRKVLFFRRSSKSWDSFAFK